MRITGQVVKKRFAQDSKSERDAVMIVTADGEYVLRRQGANPFQDPELDDLVGKTVEAEGVLHGYSFLATDLHSVASQQSQS